MHYHRFRRHGSTETVKHRASPGTRTVEQGYVLLKDPQHPLANNRGWVYEHRVVLWDRLGAGEHPCDWCGLTVRWDDSTLCADHLDGDRQNNDAANVLVSCRSCNSGRRTTDPDRARGWAQTVALRRLVAAHQAEYERYVGTALARHQLSL